MRDLQRSFASIQLSAIFRREVPNLAQALSLPPIWVRRIYYGDFVTSFKVELIVMARFKVVEYHVEICRQETLVFLEL